METLRFLGWTNLVFSVASKKMTRWMLSDKILNSWRFSAVNTHEVKHLLMIQKSTQHLFLTNNPIDNICWYHSYNGLMIQRSPVDMKNMPPNHFSRFSWQDRYTTGDRISSPTASNKGQLVTAQLVFSSQFSRQPVHRHPHWKQFSIKHTRIQKKIWQINPTKKTSNSDDDHPQLKKKSQPGRKWFCP